MQSAKSCNVENHAWKIIQCGKLYYAKKRILDFVYVEYYLFVMRLKAVFLNIYSPWKSTFKSKDSLGKHSKKIREYLGFFPNVGPPPLLGTPYPNFFSVYIAFYALRDIFDFHQKVKILSIFLLLLLGIGDNPPLSHFPNSQISRSFLRNEQNQMNFR